MTRRARLCLNALGAVVLLVVTIASPAAAHSKLISVSPQDGAVLATAPAEVSFTFDEDLLPGVDVIAITDAAGNLIASASVEPQGPTVRMPWPADAPPGMYQASYRVVSGDGHPVTGAVVFTVGSGGSPASVMPSATSSAEPVAQPAAAETGFPWAVVVLALALTGLVIAVLVGWRRRRST